MRALFAPAVQLSVTSAQICLDRAKDMVTNLAVPPGFADTQWYTSALGPSALTQALGFESIIANHRE